MIFGFIPKGRIMYECDTCHTEVPKRNLIILKKYCWDIWDDRKSDTIQLCENCYHKMMDNLLGRQCSFCIYKEGVGEFPNPEICNNCKRHYKDQYFDGM